MKRPRFSQTRRVLRAGPAITLLFTMQIAAEPTAAVKAAYEAYAKNVEIRLAQEHQPASGYLAPVDWAQARQGKLIVEELTPRGGKVLGGALLHDWRGTAFVAGAKAADFERLLKAYADYPQVYAPQVIRTQVLPRDGDHDFVTMRVRQQHILTVVMDATYDVTFGQNEPGGGMPQRGSSTSRSVRIVEVEKPGTAQERMLGPGEEHGFLWRLNSYWSYEERDGGLYMQIESVSLSRSIPVGLGWVIGPFVESVPRDSLEFTLRATRDALRRQLALDSRR